MQITVKYTGTTPLLMHNPRMVDPQFALQREIKTLTSKRVKTDDDLLQIERLEWYGGLYEEGGVVVQPVAKMRKCLVNTGKINKLGTAVGRALTWIGITIPLVYEGPRDIDELFALSQYHSRLSVGIGGKRVMRVRPQFFPWALEAQVLFAPDAGLKWSELKDLVALAGIAEGIGDNRINGYGRFIGEVKKNG